MRKTSIFIALLVMFIFSIMKTQAARYEPYRFEKGSWIKYELFAYSNATETPTLVIETNEIDWVMFIVEDTFENSIALRKKITFKNGTQTQQICEVNLSTGSGIEIPIIIASNLENGDYIFDQSQISNPPKIEKTIEKAVLGKIRKINVASYTVYFDLWGDNGATLQFFWDKETGVLCMGEILNWELIKGGVKAITLWQMVLIDKSDNLWSENKAPEILGIVIIIGIIVTLILITVLIKRGR